SKRGLGLRQAALNLFFKGLDGGNEERLLSLATKLEDGPILAEALRQLSKWPKVAAGPLLLDKLKVADAEVPAAALEAGGELRISDAGTAWPKLLADTDGRVRAAAATAAGKLGARDTSDTLVKLAKDAIQPCAAPA